MEEAAKKKEIKEKKGQTKEITKKEVVLKSGRDQERRKQRKFKIMKGKRIVSVLYVERNGAKHERAKFGSNV